MLEEIIVYNKDESKIEGLVSIVECAMNDLSKISKIWASVEES